MEKKTKRPGGPGSRVPMVKIVVDMSKPDPDEDLITKPIRLEGLEARRWRWVTASLVGLGILAGILIGKFLLP